MKLQSSLVCLCAVLAAASSQEKAAVLNPRGPRPSELGFKDDKCATEKEWPICTDEDWGNKCPSGCRLQGLVLQTDNEIHEKIRKINKLLDEGKRTYRSADQVSKDTYTYLREKLVTSAGSDTRYATLAEQLRQRIVEMKIKIDRQLRILESLKSQVKDQVAAVQRTEVDIDIKLRSCKGSCASHAPFALDKESYGALDKQVERLDGLRVQSVETVSSLKVMKSRPMKDVVVPSIYKSGQQRALFPDVGQVQLSLEAEGSTAETAATVSKDSKGIGSPQPVAPSGVGKGSESAGCSKTVRKTVTPGKDGPVEKYETVISGGPGCDDHLSSAKQAKEPGAGGSKSITTLSHGDVDLAGLGGDFFKGLGISNLDRKFSSSSSSSSSSTSSKTVLTGGSKGLFSDTKSILSTDSPDAFSDDLGAFLRGEVEDDHPDIHARSLKSRDERKADLIGGDCVDIQQNHAKGGQSGLFKLKPAGSEEVVEVYCDQDTGLGGWAVVQQREDGSVGFNRTWDEYRAGFGKLDERGKGELWIGNRLLHLLARNESLLRVELQDWRGKEAYAEYNVRVGPEATGFRLSASSYEGDAGDALARGHAGSGSFLSHDGMAFSTFDKDADRWEENCAAAYGGGWWYNNCQSANLNGVYYKGGKYDPGSKENGVVWLPFRPADYSLKVARMKIRPA